MNLVNERLHTEIGIGECFDDNDSRNVFRPNFNIPARSDSFHSMNQRYIEIKTFVWRQIRLPPSLAIRETSARLYTAHE